MTGIVLDQPVLTLVDDPTGAPLFLLRTDLPQFDFNTDGEVRTYAGGERIGTARVGIARTATMSVAVDRPTLSILGGWRGALVCYRDGLQVRLFARYYSLPWQPFEDGRLFNVTLRFEEVTYDETAG